MDKKIKVAVIAAGGRSQGVVSGLLNDSKRNVEIAAIYDPDPAQIVKAKEKWQMPDAKECTSLDEAVNFPGVEWVMIFSPNVFHKEGCLAAFKAGKNVFCEKPMATSIEDCQEIFDAHQASGKLFATGFVLRYSPVYEKVKEVLSSGILGRLYAINANENIAPGHGGYIMCNWRRLKRFSGPHILEKCCHDLDLINWFCESLPSRVASFGNRTFFVPENQPLMDKYGDSTFHFWDDPHRLPSPFTADKDILDNEVSIAEYRNGIMVSFQCTMANAIPERRMYFTCTEGTMKLDLYQSKLVYKRLGDPCLYTINFGADGHGGGDSSITKELYRSMCDGTLPKCSGDAGLESAVFALALDRSVEERSIIDLEPVWQRLKR